MGISKSGKTYTNALGKRTAVRGANKTTNGYGKNTRRGVGRTQAQVSASRRRRK